MCVCVSVNNKKEAKHLRVSRGGRDIKGVGGMVGWEK